MGFLRYLQGTSSRDSAKKTVSNYDEHLKKKQNKLKLKEAQPQVNVARPTSFAEIEQLIKTLRDTEGVIVDLRDAPEDVGQRFLDYLSGAVFALSGNVERLENKMFLLTPKGVNIIATKKECEQLCKRKLTQKP